MNFKKKLSNAGRCKNKFKSSNEVIDQHFWNFNIKLVYKEKDTAENKMSKLEVRAKKVH